MKRSGPLVFVGLLVACAPPIVSVEGVVRDAYRGEPLADVTITSENSGEVVTSAQDGTFAITVPEGSSRLRLARTGYHDGQRVNVRPGQDVDAVLFPTDASDLEITEHMLAMGPSAPISVRAAAIDEVGSVRVPLIDRPIDLPETIRVWRSQGTPLQPAGPSWTDASCNAAAIVETLPLEEYVKGVIPHEWSPSWHPEALQAGAVAARSFAVGHILRGGRWDCADVDDGTVTQVYRDDRSDSTNDAVEATRGQVIWRAGAVVLAEYSAENDDPTMFGVDDPTCTGTTRFGHGRGMCQWGTQRWALGTCANAPCDLGAFGTDPKDYEWMVQHYFPDAEVAGDPADVVPCGILPAEGGIIDDAGPCVSLFGAASYWRTETIGYDGGLRWTNAFVTASPSNWGRFRIHVAEAGRYSLEVYVEPGFGGHPAVNYTVEDTDGARLFAFDQRAASGWSHLLDMRITDTGSVSVFDTAEVVDDAERRVVIDAIRLTRLDTTTSDAGTPSTPDGGVVPPADSGSVDGPGREMVSGCGCRTGPGSPMGPATWAALVGMVWLTRRRMASRR